VTTFPRKRGGDPYASMAMDYKTVFSPHTRG